MNSFAELAKLTALKKLELSIGAIYLIGLDELSLPSLEEFTLRLFSFRGDETTVGTDFVRFISSGFPNLKQLALHFDYHVRNCCTRGIYVISLISFQSFLTPI